MGGGVRGEENQGDWGVGATEGGKSAGAAYPLVRTAKVHGLNVQTYAGLALI